MLDASSQKLHAALKKSAYFKSVTIVVPSIWRDSKCQNIIRFPWRNVPYKNANFVVSEYHGIFSDVLKEPLTQQSRGCGEPGDLLTIPFDLILKLNSTQQHLDYSAKSLVREWAKYRYGIFDEMGYNGDHLYPRYFKSNGNLVPSFDNEMKGEWKNILSLNPCNPEIDNECVYVPDQSSLESVNCSMGNLHFLPNVTSFCSSGERTQISPTKHNILCNGQSSNRIIFQHADFVKHRQITAARLTPKINIVREPEQRYVLVMETSSAMDENEHWKWINKAAQKLIRFDLPVNSYISIVTFSDTAKIEHRMVQVHSDQVRARLADTIPDKYHLSKSSKGCILCALKLTMDKVIKGQEQGSHFILVTKGKVITTLTKDEEKLKEYVIENDITLSSIVIPETKSEQNSTLLSEISKKVHIVQRTEDENVLEFFVTLNRAFADILHAETKYPTETPEMVHKKTFFSGSGGSSSGTFLIDSTLGRDTEFGIFVQDEEDHMIKSIEFTDSQGKKYGPFLRMSSDYDLINLKTINFPTGKAPPFSAVSSF